MLHRLELADGLAELLARLGVLHRDFHDALHAAYHFRRQRHRGDGQGALQSGARGIADRQEISFGDRDVFKRHLVEFARFVDGRERRDRQAARAAGHDKQAQVRMLGITAASAAGVAAGPRRAAQTRKSAAAASGTNIFRPLSAKPASVGCALSCTAPGSQLAEASSSASVACASPSEMRERYFRFWAGLPAASMATPASRTVERYGPGSRARPISSSATAISTKPRPRPPYSSSKMMPVQPWCAIFCQSAAS